jgi:hypothetical protein
MEQRRLTYDEKATAYRNLVNRFYLRHQQRTALDAMALDAYRPCIAAAHRRDWATVEDLLNAAGIIHSEAGSR